MQSSTMSRRAFLRSTSAAGAALYGVPGLVSVLSARPRLLDTTLRVLSIGVVGTVGETDRKQVASHPRAEVVGLCDVDAAALAQAGEDHPDAFQCADYREAFDKHGDSFDAVIVATPDHSHCAIMTMALARGKHVYGQKPLVHDLEELEILERATRKQPRLATQTGAQRIASPTRRAAVDILKSGALGKVIEAHIGFSGGPLVGGYYFADGTLGEPCAPPEGFNYDLWLNGAHDEPCRPDMVQRKWRSWWNFGTGMVGDWIVHLIDVLMYAYPELKSPTQVCTRTPSRNLAHFHADRVLSTLTYPVTGSRFANSNFNLYIWDASMKPDRAQLGIGAGDWSDDYFTIVVCEGGTLLLYPEGPVEVWRDGEKTDGMSMPGLPKYESFNHWHAWVDAALGESSPNLWAPFAVGLRCTEPGILAVKAAKYPGQELHWDRQQLRFTNHVEASRTIVRRSYRDGFAPVRVSG